MADRYSEWAEVPTWRASRSLPELGTTNCYDLAADKHGVTVVKASAGGSKLGSLVIKYEDLPRLIELLESIPERPEWLK
jgi:hypothetical protein